MNYVWFALLLERECRNMCVLCLNIDKLNCSILQSLIETDCLIVNSQKISNSWSQEIEIRRHGVINNPRELALVVSTNS